MDDVYRRSHDSAFSRPARVCLHERRLMFRNSSLAFTTLLIAAVAAPLHASGVTKVSENSRLSAEPQFNVAIAPESSTEETIHVQTWIPGFDDGEPVSVCSPILTPKFSV